MFEQKASIHQRLLLILFTIAVSSFVNGQQGVSRSQSEIDLIHYGDVIDVDVIGSLDFDWRGTLNPEGFLDGMERVEEPIYALCRSESEVVAAITAQYEKTLRDPKVVVRIVDRTNRAVAILDGAVKKPQRFQIKRPARLSELIVLAGGITDRSNGEISIFRPQSLNCLDKIGAEEGQRETFIKTGRGNGSQMFNIRIADLLSAKEGANPEILSGDIVTVAEASPIYIIGGVNNPRQISSKSSVTLTRAIASAGGLSKDATEEKITIFRRSGRQSTTIDIDLQRIKHQQAEDPELKAFDVVDVGQKGRGKRKFPPVIDLNPNPNRLSGLPLNVID